LLATHARFSALLVSSFVLRVHSFALFTVKSSFRNIGLPFSCLLVCGARNGQEAKIEIENCSSIIKMSEARPSQAPPREQAALAQWMRRRSVYFSFENKALVF
jgi:hypothetical protein